jgi:hypothetical protein
VVGLKKRLLLTFLSFFFSFLWPPQYYAGHELFLDGSSAVFVVVVRLDQPLQESAWQLRYWLRFLKGRMRGKPEDGRRPMVVVVGSHRDAAGEDVRSVEGVEGKEWTSVWGGEQLRSVSCFGC